MNMHNPMNSPIKTCSTISIDILLRSHEYSIMGGSIVMGVPQARWMVSKGKSQTKMGENWGYQGWTAV